MSIDLLGYIFMTIHTQAALGDFDRFVAEMTISLKHGVRVVSTQLNTRLALSTQPSGAESNAAVVPIMQR